MNKTGLIDVVRAVNWVTEVFDDIRFCDLGTTDVGCGTWVSEEGDVSLRPPSDWFFGISDYATFGDPQQSKLYLWTDPNSEKNEPEMTFQFKLYRKRYEDPDKAFNVYIQYLDLLDKNYEIISNVRKSINTGQVGLFTDVVDYDQDLRWINFSIIDKGILYEIVASAKPDIFSKYKKTLDDFFSCIEIY